MYYATNVCKETLKRLNSKIIGNFKIINAFNVNNPELRYNFNNSILPEYKKPMFYISKHHDKIEKMTTNGFNVRPKLYSNIDFRDYQYLGNNIDEITTHFTVLELLFKEDDDARKFIPLPITMIIGHLTTTTNIF